MKKNRLLSKKNQGFALIATILLMVLLAIITIGTLSLSVVTLRTSNQDSAQARARANARMALMIAIGELQKQMGPDQRISANSDILLPDSSSIQHRHWTGSWNSWKAGDGESSQHSTIQGVADQMAPTYLPNRSDYFRKWLVSLNDTEASSISSPLNLSLEASNLPSDKDDAVYLVSAGSLGDDTDNTKDFVAARLLDIKDLESSQVTGRYGWWVGDESQKARIMDDSYAAESTLTTAEKIFRQQSPASTGTKTVPGLDGLQDDTQLAALPSLQTLDLVTGAKGRPAQLNFHDITPHSYQVLADVREGGLKRDLSTLLERPINPSERSNEFMLYKFNTKDTWANIPTLPNTPQECVPIQDLAAYYQLYDRSRKGGIEYATSDIKVTTPNYGTKAAYTLHQDYTSMYRNPIPIKVQFVLTLRADPITTADRLLTHTQSGVTYTSNLSIPASDSHKLRIAVIPVVTLWNPYNVPITMQSGTNCQSFRLKTPSFFIRCSKRRSTGQTYNQGSLNLTFASKSSSMTGGIAEGRTDLLRLNFGYTGPAVNFAPGDVKIFSMPYTSAGQLYTITGNQNHLSTYPINNLEANPGWNATGFLTFMHSTTNTANRNITVPNTDLTNPVCNVVWERAAPIPTTTRYSLSLNSGDELTFSIHAENPAAGANTPEAVGRKNSPVGAAMSFYMIQRSIAIDSYAYLNMRNYNLVTRMGNGTTNPYPGLFNNQLLRRGIPGGATSYPIEPISANNIINAGGAGSGATVPLMQFALKAGSEVSESVGDFAGRKFPMRPFLHSSVLSSTVIDDNSLLGPYNHGWNWWFEDIGSILGALVNNTQTGNGFYGGGYTPEAGVNRVIQQEIPLAPPISIATLSHARLGGFTLANELPAGHGLTGTGQAEGYPGGGGWIDNPAATLGFQRVTATGQGGLFPHTIQAIGNSYAHPLLAANQAFNTNWDRLYNSNDGIRKVTFADHSYLANKALWDEFFFSSLTPQKSTIEVFGGSDKTVNKVATDFFVANPATPLPNRRMTAYSMGMDQAKLDSLLAEILTYNNGMADKIAAHMMVEGSFNINSTSVVAWKTFLSSLKGQPVAHLNGGKTPTDTPTTGTAFGGFTMPSGAPVTTITDSKLPAGQWMGSRELSDDEIDQLANAIVVQIKQRGPFLSLSEFVNRRLQSGNDSLSVKGALQSALDDTSVSINESFRDDPDRILDAETQNLTFPFAAAAKGPVAYGSSAYIDQADVLRHIGSQITARGDTFVIRTYGDAIDLNGKVIARAWCEAVVQRVPEYVNSVDEPHLKQADSTLSEISKIFGRKIQMISFRWLNQSEI